MGEGESQATEEGEGMCVGMDRGVGRSEVAEGEPARSRTSMRKDEGFRGILIIKNRI